MPQLLSGITEQHRPSFKCPHGVESQKANYVVSQYLLATTGEIFPYGKPVHAGIQSY
jgi:hypothetical protein